MTAHFDCRQGSAAAGAHSLDQADLVADEEVELRPADEGRRVIELEESFWRINAVAGADCYAIDYSWWHDWCEYTGVVVSDGKSASVIELENGQQQRARPGPIDNTKLQSSAADLIEGVDYTFKSPATWKLFRELYPDSGPEVRRTLQADGQTEFYSVRLYLRRSSEVAVKGTRAPKSAVYIPKHGTVGDLKKIACQVFGLALDDVRLFDWYQDKKYSQNPMEDDQTMDSNKILEDQSILVEEKVDGKFPEPEETATTSFYSAPSLMNRYTYAAEDTIVAAEGAIPGTAGLGNLGNTCFMNSTVQCLAHSIPLMQVFLSGAYRADLNRDNPLGNKGELAEAFGALMEKLWQGQVRSVSPRKFKQQISNFAPHFAGYQQHDSQELLAFLLDGLHEDLNRVKNKPYFEEPDSDGRPDQEVAAEAWRHYKARNDSFIVDHFQGMYKSTLVCPDCKFHSVKMDSFNCLSLPLPSAKMRTIQVTVVTMDGSAPPMQYALEVLKLGVIGDLYKALARVCEIREGNPAEVLLLVEIYNGRVHTKFTDLKEPLADGIRSSSITLLAYKYPSTETGPASGGKELHVFQRRARKRASSFYFGNERYEVFAAPLILWLPEERIQAEASAGEGSPVEALVAAEGPLTQAVETALRPFKRQKIEASSPPTQPLVHEPASQPQEPREELASKDECRKTSSDTDLSSMEAQPPEVELLPGALSISPRDTPQASPVTSPIGSPRDGSGGSTSFQGGLPFDMFSGHSDAAENPSTGAAPTIVELTAATDGLPYTIHLAAPNGQPSSSKLSLEDGQLFFAIDWAADAANHYEPERIEQPQLHSSVEEAKARQAAGPKPYTLDECVEAFLEGERLEDSESWYCKRCKKLVQADKKLDLWTLPEVLVVHLKRFSYSHRFRDKIEVLVKFPLTGLDLSGATLRPQELEPVYDLFAVSNHFGGLGGGHYTAFCKLNEDGKWYNFDDSATYEVAADRVVSDAAYVLFYRRRTESMGDAGKDLGALLTGAAHLGSAEENPDSDQDMEQATDVIEPMEEQGHGPSLPLAFEQPAATSSNGLLGLATDRCADPSDSAARKPQLGLSTE